MCSYPIEPRHTNILQFTLKRMIVGGIRGQARRALAANRPNACFLHQVHYMEGNGL